jgi:type III pantothenate kinase
MMLMVDMGNSSLKWATLNQNRLNPQQSKLYEKNSLDDVLLQAWLTLEVPWQGIWVSNVAGLSKADILTHWVKKHWGLEATFVKTSSNECGVKNGYDNPAQLGIDRWLALIGARHLVKGKLCVVDCGTAITVDVLSADGQHQGGLIIPGLVAMYRALLSDTYAVGYSDKTLPNVWDRVANTVQQSLFKEKPFLAHDTNSGITLGALSAAVGLIEYVMNTLEKPKDSFTTLLTGGSVPILRPFLQMPYQHVPDLVLQGLKIIVNQSL